MDLSYSMKDDLENVKNLGTSLMQEMSNITSDFRIGECFLRAVAKECFIAVFVFGSTCQAAVCCHCVQTYMDQLKIISLPTCSAKGLVRLWKRQSCRTSAPPRPSCWTRARGTRTAPVHSATNMSSTWPKMARRSTPWWASSKSLEIWTLLRGDLMPSCKWLCVR